MPERPSLFDQLWDFFPKTHIWEDSCNRPDDVCSRPYALIHKASRALKSRHLDVSLHGPNAQASYMEIVCIRSTVWKVDVMVHTGQALI
jgi:hypothetical protein